MKCSKCGYDNPPGMKFCGACGTPLPQPCPACGFANPVEFKFCGQCGTQLTPEPTSETAPPRGLKPEPSAAPEPPVEPAPPVAPTGEGLLGERRRATVILADIKGSTALAERVDVETWVEIMNRVFQILGAEIYRYGGEINQYRGDGLVAFFGLPTAHEDDPERAVLAALAMQDAVKRYAQELAEEQAIELLLRVGINTGEVIATSVGDSQQHSEETAMGRAIALAARMETASEPGTVLVTENTYRLVSTLFEWQELGEITVKGVSQPVNVYRPLARRDAPRRGRGIAGMASPLVGRDAESRALRNAIERLRSGIGGIVTVVGEAGLGKSRLVTEIRNSVIGMDEPPGTGATELTSPGPRPVQWIEGRCLSYATTVAYQVWLNVVHNLLDIAPDTPASVICDALERWIRTTSPDRYEDVFPFMARMLSLSLNEETEALLRGLGAQGLQVSTFRALETLVERVAAQRPLVLVCEDLHWSDPTSLELLERLLPLVDRLPLLLVCMLRPEREHGCWRIVEIAARDYPHRHTDLRLRPLSASDGETLLKNLLLSYPGSDGQEPVEGLPQALKTQILSRGEGNPFYVEEILRTLTQSGAIVCDEVTCQWRAGQATDEILIPDTLYGVLRARIDQLPPGARRLLQVASVIGRIFSRRLLAQIVPEDELQEHLVTLQRTQMIRERARLPELEYIFKHHLTQEAAYDSLLTRERRAYHRQVAEGLERIYSERMEERTGLLAHHWDRADEPQQAIPYLLRAGEQARSAHANEEAIDHLQRALAQLDRASVQQPLRSQAETLAARLDALRGLGIVYLVTAQIPEAERHLREAIAVGEEIGLDVRERVRLYYWLGETLWWQSRHEDRIRVGEQGLALLGDDTESIEAALMNATIAVGYWESVDWEKHHEITYRTAEFLPHLPYSEELRPVYVHAWMVNLADRNLEQARGWLQALQERATASQDLLALLEASFSQAVTCARVGDLHGALSQVQQPLELSARIGNLLHELRSRYLIAVIMLSLGDLQQIQELASSTVEVMQGIQGASGMAFALQFAGWAFLCLDHTEAAIEALEQAAALFKKTRLPFCEAGVTCQLGRARLAQGDLAGAAQSFQSALSMASQRELGGYVHWSSNVLVIPNPTVADALSGLQEAVPDRKAFEALCQRFRAEATDGPFLQWALDPATPLEVPKPLLREPFAKTLSPEWTWHDPFDDCSYAVSNGLELRAANGRDLLSVNLSAPRLLRPASRDWAVQTRCTPVSDDRPAIGGLTLWMDEENYLRLDRGATNEHDLYFGGSLDNRDVLIGRGRLPRKDTDRGTQSTYLRLERMGDRVAALGSTDGENWFTVGSVTFPVKDPVQVGVHAIGKIDRAVYRGAHPDGTAIRFQSFHMWRL